MTDAAGTYTLVYWPIRGLGAPIRMAMTLAKLPFRDESPDRAQWFSAENPYRTENPIANLPLLRTPTGRLVTQSGSILRFLGRLGNLYGANADESSRVDEVIEHIAELHKEKITMTYGPNFAQCKDDYLNKSVPYYFGQLEAYIAKNGTTFSASNDITIADLLLYENAVGTMACYDNPDVLAIYPHITRIVAAVRALPALRDYHASAESVAFNGASGNWGALRM